MIMLILDAASPITAKTIFVVNAYHAM